ncbi:unnamed protein product [Adineta steineri]|uniref:Peptidase C45 hydrolase domain-containing protein n=1 Tax=Adineta steineri TaxID=433720 RepID=A0A813RW17_9BILA|nr:unnamed protein product [Adineta steineri]CAF3663185.1 unnamed protein product [Adineta steineri]
MSSEIKKNNDHERIPFYSLEGTHYEYSFKLGQLISKKIEERIEKELKDLQPLFDFIKTDDGLKYLNSYTNTIQKQFPWYYDELKGLSDGSKIPLEKILVLNYKNELKAGKDLSDKKETNEQGRTSCSTVLINRFDSDKQLLLIAHNEDESNSNWNTCFILQATIKSSIYTIHGSEQQRESPYERYIAFGYAGQLAGNGFGGNHHGFVFTYNGLYPKTPLIENCLPRQLHNRVVLNVKNEQELNTLVRTQLTAYGFNLNVGRFRYPNVTADKYLLNYEIGPSNDQGKTNQYNINYILNDKQFFDDKFRTKNKDIKSTSFAHNYDYHFNHYVHLKEIPQEETPLPSSTERAKRASEFEEIKVLNQALEFLGDEKYKCSHPVYRRSSTGKTNTVTLCTAVIDLNKSMLYVYDDNPQLTTILPFFQFDLNTL